jgi:hypothetical protein
MGRLKGVLGKALSAVAVIGVAAVGVAAVFTVGSVISRRKESGVSSPESRVQAKNENQPAAVTRESQEPANDHDELAGAGPDPSRFV